MPATMICQRCGFRIDDAYEDVSRQCSNCADRFCWSCASVMDDLMIACCLLFVPEAWSAA